MSTFIKSLRSNSYPSYLIVKVEKKKIKKKIKKFDNKKNKN